MTITMVSAIPPVGGARSKMPFDAITDAYITSAGSAAELALAFTGGAAANDTLGLVWEFGDISFLFVSTTPDGSGTELPAYVSGDISTWLASVATYMAKNYYLNRDYTITSAGDAVSGTITITAVNIGTDYSFTVASSVTNCTPTNTAGTDRTTEDNFSIALDIYVYNGSTPELKASRTIVPGDDQHALFYYQDVLLPHLAWDVPAFNMAAPIIDTSVILKYELRIAELYGTPAVHKSVSVQAYKYAMLAGLDFIDWPNGAYLTSGFLKYITAQDKFLSWQPIVKRTTPTSHEYLTYIIDAASITSLILKGTCHYSDGTTETQTIFTQAGTARYEVYRFPAGYNQVNIPGIFTIPVGESVTKYDLWLTNQSGTTITEVRTFIVDALYYRNKKQFIYQNSLGGIDTLNCTGEREYTIEVERQLARKILPDSWSLTAFDGKGSIENFRTFATETYRIFTGPVYRLSEIKALREFILSPKVLEVGSHYYLPVTINNSTVKLYKTSDDMYGIEFEVSKAWEDELWSNTGSGSGS